MPGSNDQARDAQGRIHPSKLVRLKVLYRCTACAADLFKSECRMIQSHRSPLRGSLAHQVTRRIGRLCGPVAFMANPAYRKQRG